MKKIIASASLVAVGTAGLHAAYAPGLSRTETSKPWTVSAAVRGFYDDNYYTAPKAEERDSWGMEISPSVGINLPMDQTLISADYIFSAKWFEDRDKNEWDTYHQFNAALDHRFSERYDIEVTESFVYSDEPESVDSNLGSPIRTDSEAIRNTGGINFNAMMTERIALGLGYLNNYYNYDQEGDGSRSALLDRIEHQIRLDGRYQVRENIIGVLGTRFGYNDYTSDDLLIDPAFIPPPLPANLNKYDGDYQDSYSYWFYGGADTRFNSKLSGSFRIGIQYTDYDNANEDATSPFIDNSLSYNYMPDSYVRFGVRHFRNATDVSVDPLNLDDPTLDQESTSLYGEVTHKITPRIMGNLIAQYQRSEFNDGTFDGDKDNYFLLGANVDYEINQFLTAEVSYNLDRLDSDISNRSFTRNRILFGVRASY